MLLTAGTRREDGSGEPYAPGDEFTFEEYTTLYAQWTALYVLQYDKNEGEGTPPSPLMQKEGTKATVAANPFTYSAHEFDAWNTQRDGNGTPYAPGDEFTFEENTTLYAQWTALYVLQYDKNEGGGTPPSTETVRTDSGVTATIVRNGKGMNRTGYTFSGWNTAKDGTGKPYDPGDDFTYEGVTTLYAQWKPDLTIDTPGLPAGTLGEGYSRTIDCQRRRGRHYVVRKRPAQRAQHGAGAPARYPESPAKQAISRFTLRYATAKDGAPKRRIR